MSILQKISRIARAVRVLQLVRGLHGRPVDRGRQEQDHGPAGLVLDCGAACQQRPNVGAVEGPGGAGSKRGVEMRCSLCRGHGGSRQLGNGTTVASATQNASGGIVVAAIPK